MKIQKILFLILCAMFSLRAAEYTWGNAGTTEWNGAADGYIVSDVNGAFLTEDVPTSLDGSTTVLQAGIFKPAPNDSLTIKNTVFIKGDVEIRFEGQASATTLEVMEINIGAQVDPDGTVTTIAPFVDGTTDAATDAAQLVFNPSQNKKIIVNVYNDLVFQGANAAGGDPLPLFVTFRGAGTTIFRLPSGKSITFGPEKPGRKAEDGDPATDGLSTAGVQVQVYMEQSKLDIFGGVDDGGIVDPGSQLLFEKWSYAQDTVNARTSEHSWIRFGQLSSFSFVSDNYQGIAESWVDVNADNDIDRGEPVLHPGYGCIAFDPSNKGSGRMILELARGQLPSGNDFTDAGFGVYGALLVPSLWATDRTKSQILNSDFRLGVYYNQRAGIKAVMRITDDVSYFERVPAEMSLTEWKQRPETDRRGLVIINHNNSIPHFANNYDGAERIDLSVWGHYNNYEPGFVLGVNGEIEVRPHLFVDYIANNQNKEIVAVHVDRTGASVGNHTSDKVKKHNPAALYAEHLPTFERRSKMVADQYGTAISDLLFLGHHEEFGSHANIRLEGNARLFARAAAPFHDEALVRRLYDQPKHDGHYHLSEFDKDGTPHVRTVCMGIGQYTGQYVPIVNASSELVMQATDLEGSHALDVEGKLTILSVDGAPIDGVVTNDDANGVVMVPSLDIDYAGREQVYNNFELYQTWVAWQAANPELPTTTVTLSDGTQYIFDSDTTIVPSLSPLSARPLPIGTWCPVFDISSINLNAELILHQVKWEHQDVTRNHTPLTVLPHPVEATVRPHIVGGELASFRSELYPPLFKLENSILACHESLVLSGVALTVTEQPTTLQSLPASLAHNLSRVICYNRGSSFDGTGYGRIIQLGSQSNRMADGVTTNLMLSSAYIDVYRAQPTISATALEPTVMQMRLESAGETGVVTGDKSLHMLYLGNDSQIHLGWPTLEADTGYTPSAIDSTVLAFLQESDPTNSKGFRFSPHETGVGELKIQSGPFYVGAGDSLEVAPPDRPMPGIDVGGVLYVNHGGKFSMGGSDDVYLNTLIGRRVARESLATGQVVLPGDQAHFLTSGAIQNYDLDFADDAALAGAHAAHIALAGKSGVHLFDTQQLYPNEEFGQAK